MATDDLKAQLREVVACGYMPAATRVALDQAFGAIVTMENHIATLEAEVARLTRIVAMDTLLQIDGASGDYAKGQTDAQQGD